MNNASSKLRPVSDSTYGLCTSSESVSTVLARDPTIAPGDAWRKLYSHHHQREPTEEKPINGTANAFTPAEILDRAAKCGNWGPTQPSRLFLQLYNDALCTLDEGPERAVVSPSLIGSCGVLPLTVISVVPDIVRHMSNVIVRAEREVILATNYWQNGVASKFVTDAIKELSRRAGQRGVKVVMKIIYDRGCPKQLFESHFPVSEKAYTDKAVGLPRPDEIPYIDLEVINYHQPILGTFHAKYMVVDRKIAILQSNNIQDNDNLEMMVHLEGPIVDSFYDMALISWHKKLDPPLPSHNTPAAQGELSSFGGNKSRELETNDVARASVADAHGGEVHEPGAAGVSSPLGSRNTLRAGALTGPTATQSVTHPYTNDELNTERSGITKPVGGARNVFKTHGVRNQQIAHFLEVGEQAIPENQIQRPSPRNHPLPEHTTDEPHYDDDIAGEVARVQTSVSGSENESSIEAITRHLNHTTNKGFKGAAPDCLSREEMAPYIPHPAQEQFPIALVCRPPYGSPNHKSVSNPQNAVWLSALRNAQKNVFIQTPTLNAEPLIPVMVEACERGIDVYCYVCLGYNDAGELLPMQGGHNEMAAHNLYKALSDSGRQHLHYFWYVAKDQTKPIMQLRRQRSCHIKLMIVDEHIGITGNGNQDTQSWLHSQEINIMLDSPAVCRAWIDALRRNQNTHLHGALSKGDGIWRDEQGNEAEGVIGVDPGLFSWTKGLVGAVKRAQGTGGF